MTDLIKVVTTLSSDAEVLVVSDGAICRMSIADFKRIIAADTTAPTITLTLSQTNVTAAGNLQLIATAADDRAIDYVAFLSGGIEFARSTAAPYECSEALAYANNGLRTYSARAVDTSGNETVTPAQAVTIAIPDPIAPTVSLSASASSMTAAGDIVLTATAADNVGVTTVEFWRDGILLSAIHAAPFSYTDTLSSNGNYSYTAIAVDAAGNATFSNAAQVVVNIPPPTPQVPFDAFADVVLDQSVAGTAWDALCSWGAKTYLVGDGAGNVKISPAIPGPVAANYASRPGEVGQAVFFRYVAQKDGFTPLLTIGMDGPGVTENNAETNTVQASLGASSFYAKVIGVGAAQGSYSLVVGNYYCLEICKDETGKNYRARVSNVANGVRGTVVGSAAISLSSTSTARPTTDRGCQILIGSGNKNAVVITRMEALTVPFDVVGAAPAPAPTPTPTPTPAQFLFPDDGTTVSGPAGVEIKFGASGSPALVEFAEKIYAGMPVGFNGATQDKWRSRPITVNGIQFVLHAGRDSNGRVDVWIHGAFGVANTQTNINREHALVDLQITIDGVAKDLFGDGVTYTYNHQRATQLRWESEPLTMQATNSFISGLIESGAFMRHDSRNAIGSDPNSGQVDTHPLYKPFKAFSATIGGNGLPAYDQQYKVGTQYRGTSAGGERPDIGPVHEWIARLISEIGTNNNPAWLTPEKNETIRMLFESIAQFPHVSGLIYPVDQRLINPAEFPLSTHRNANAWSPCLGIPQPGSNSTTEAERYFDGFYDNAHPANKISYHAHALTNDPWHLFLTQAQAVTCLAFCTGRFRGSDGKTSIVIVEEERGFWWALQTLFHAWKATPEGPMPKPFRDKAFFKTAIDNTLNWIRTSFMTPNSAFDTPTWRAAKFWRVVAPFGISTFPGEVFFSPFMVDYGHFVLGEALLMGYSGARDVVEWHAENIRLRAQCGGSWYDADRVLSAQGSLAQSIGYDADTALPYSDVTSYKAWHPRRDTGYINGPLLPDQWYSGRALYLFLGVLNLYQNLQVMGKVSLTFDPTAEYQALIDRHPGPYVGSNGNQMNCPMHAKQYVRAAS